MKEASTRVQATGEVRTRQATRGQELARFTATAGRGIDGFEVQGLPVPVIVTGGTGCIGTVLLRHLRASNASVRLVSFSRRPVLPCRRVAGVEYAIGDVRDPVAVRSLIATVRPEVVFHLAAQRDPGAAERRVEETVATNLLGTSNVVASTADVGRCRLVLASSGKALRYYPSDVYAATKALAEDLARRMLEDTTVGLACVRFTHVVDNSLVLRRLRRWASRGEPLRLHGPAIYFYAQSARECGQLLLAGPEVAARRGASVIALRNLGWPVDLTKLALDVSDLYRQGSPVVVGGYEAGYEAGCHPATYDPVTAGDVSPLFNALEARRVERAVVAGHAIDSAPLSATSRGPAPAMEALLSVLQHGGPRSELRARLSRAAVELLRVRLDDAGEEDVARLLRARRPPGGMSASLEVVESALRERAKACGLAC